MERTFSFDARAVVPTTHGLTSETPERGQNQNEADEQAERHRIADGRQPRCSNRADQKIRSAKDEVGHRKSAAKAQAVGSGSAENREKPHHAAEDAGQRSGLLGGEIQLLLQIQGERSKRPVVGKTLENFGDVGDPERLLEPGADFLEALRESQIGSCGLWRGRSRPRSAAAVDLERTGAVTPATRITLFRLV